MLRNTFISVRSNGRLLFVIELYVRGSAVNTGGSLSKTPQGVFLRRDGSVQQLTASDIEESTRRVGKLKN